MKKLIMLLVLVLVLPLVLPSSAFSNSIDECNINGKFAATVMRLRQRNIDVSEILQTLSQFDSAKGDAMRAITLDAYSTPSFSTKKYQDRAIIRFKNKYFINCYGK